MRFAAKFAVGVFLCLAAWQTQAAEIGYLEDFALAKDRTVPLQQLIPGTEDYYYYHCLHFQNTEQFDKVNELLTAWINRYKDTPGIREIQNRQALLTYSQEPGQVAWSSSASGWACNSITSASGWTRSRTCRPAWTRT